jgi:hypothetical protein
MMLFRAASGFFPGMLQNHVVIEPQRTAGPVPQEAEAQPVRRASARCGAKQIAFGGPMRLEPSDPTSPHGK